MSSLTLLGKIIIAGIVLVIVGAVFAFVSIKDAHTPGPVACTMEAKLCPDGTAVGRTGPNCEFAACPTSTSTSATSTPIATTTPGGTGDGGLTYKSGIRGTIMAGPTCPVERNPPDPACADKPLQTLVSIFRASDLAHVVMQIQSNASGTFEVSLPPGNYMVGAGESSLPRCTQTPAVVASNTYTTMVVPCDTGIR
ncbi:MAG TPA: hypothetical protein VIJ88_01165 [Candidatus Paceibacterota bacterium]